MNANFNLDIKIQQDGRQTDFLVQQEFSVEHFGKYKLEVPGETEKTFKITAIGRAGFQVFAIVPNVFDDGTGKLTYKVGGSGPYKLTTPHIFRGSGQVLGYIPEEVSEITVNNQYAETVSLDILLLADSAIQAGNLQVGSIPVISGTYTVGPDESCDFEDFFSAFEAFAGYYLNVTLIAFVPNWDLSLEGLNTSEILGGKLTILGDTRYFAGFGWLDGVSHSTTIDTVGSVAEVISVSSSYNGIAGNWIPDLVTWEWEAGDMAIPIYDQGNEFSEAELVDVGANTLTLGFSPSPVIGTNNGEGVVLIPNRSIWVPAPFVHNNPNLEIVLQGFYILSGSYPDAQIEVQNAKMTIINCCFSRAGDNPYYGLRVSGDAFVKVQFCSFINLATAIAAIEGGKIEIDSAYIFSYWRGLFCDPTAKINAGKVITIWGQQYGVYSQGLIDFTYIADLADVLGQDIGSSTGFFAILGGEISGRDVVQAGENVALLGFHATLGGKINVSSPQANMNIQHGFKAEYGGQISSEWPGSNDNGMYGWYVYRGGQIHCYTPFGSGNVSGNMNVAVNTMQTDGSLITQNV